MSFHYYKDFSMGLTYRIDDSTGLVECTLGQDWWWKSVHDSLTEVNYGYEGSLSEAVPVDENGERL